MASQSGYSQTKRGSRTCPASPGKAVTPQNGQMGAGPSSSMLIPHDISLRMGTRLTLNQCARGQRRSVLHLDADFDAGWSAYACSSHGVFQIGIGGEGMGFIDRAEPV